MTLKQLRDAWNQFWFAPSSPAPICVFRILLGLQIFFCGLFWLPNLLIWYGEHGVESAQTIRLWYGTPRFDLLTCFGAGDSLTIVLYAVLILASGCLTLGLFSRSSAAVAWLLLLSFHHRNEMIINAGDHLLRLGAFLLIFAPAGKMYSLDAWLKYKRGKISADIMCEPWVQRLLQILMCAVYYRAFTSKLSDGNWWNGTAVYYAVHCKEFYRLPLLPLFDVSWVCQFLNWATLGIEFSLFSLVWITEFRYWILLCGLILHLGIERSMILGMFQYTMVSLYINFVEPQKIEQIMQYAVTAVTKACRRLKQLTDYRRKLQLF